MKNEARVFKLLFKQYHILRRYEWLFLCLFGRQCVHSCLCGSWQRLTEGYFRIPKTVENESNLLGKGVYFKVNSEQKQVGGQIFSRVER